MINYYTYCKFGLDMSANTTSEALKETLDKIHGQLSGGESDLYSSKDKSIKYYIAHISTSLSRWIYKKERDTEQNIYNTNFALGFLAIASITLIRLGSQENPDFEWVEKNSLSIQIWGIIMAAVYIGASIERSELFKSVWKFSFTKLIASIAVSGLIAYSTGKAASAINSIFGVDASALPITLIFTTAIILFHLIAPFLLGISLAILIHIMIVVGWIKAKIKDETHDFPPFHSIMFSIVAAIIMYFGWEWSNNELSKSRLPEKIYLMAHSLDFNGKHLCANIPDSTPVIFLGADQNSVLVTPHGLEDFDFSTFFTASVEIPTHFDRSKCMYSKYQTNQ